MFQSIRNFGLVQSVARTAVNQWVVLAVLLAVAAIGTHADPAITLQSSPNPAVYGHPVTLTATVLEAGAIGSVTFFDGTSPLGAAPILNGHAKLTTSLVASGKRTLTAAYLGNSAETIQTVMAVPGNGFGALVAYGPRSAVGSSSIVAADFNNDGYVDLLTSSNMIWGGEFGRTPMVESNPALNRKLGRDHHPQAFTIWMAGGGIKPGLTFGATDELGFHVAQDPVHVHDVQATVLHLLGLDHERLTYRHAGRDFRLTDVSGRVIQPILA